MNIFWSCDYAIDKINSDLGSEFAIDGSSGWGHLYNMLRDALTPLGANFVLSPEDADIEFYLGQGMYYSSPMMSPSVVFTMNETTSLPKSWIETYNLFDAVINPSPWGVECFKNDGIYKPVHFIPLCVNAEKFKYVDRTIDEDWLFLAQSLKLIDRKNAHLVGEIFNSGKMPSDCKLYIKTKPEIDSGGFVIDISPQVKLIDSMIPFDVMIDELYNVSHVSVNPSCGEGFGFLPVEHMSTGMCSIITAFSGFSQLVRNGIGLPLRFKEVPSGVCTGGNWASPDVDHLYELMIWTYENREESMELGKKYSSYVQEEFNMEKIGNQIINCLADLICKVDKKVSNIVPSYDLSTMSLMQGVNLMTKKKSA